MESVKLAALVREIGQVAPQVGKEFEEQQAAFEAERAAKETLLASVIAMAKPGLAAVANDIPSAFDDGVLLLECKARNGKPLRVYLQTSGELWEEWQKQDEDDPDRWYHVGETRTVRSVIEKYDVADLVTGLHASLIKQVGKRVPSTTNAREGATKVNAILTLLDAAPAADGCGPYDIPF